MNQTTSEIVNRKPRFICIEDLNVSGMMKNRYLSKAVQNQGFFEFRKQLEHKCRDKGIQLIVAEDVYKRQDIMSAFFNFFQKKCCKDTGFQIFFPGKNIFSVSVTE